MLKPVKQKTRLIRAMDVLESAEKGHIIPFKLKPSLIKAMGGLERSEGYVRVAPAQRHGGIIYVCHGNHRSGAFYYEHRAGTDEVLEWHMAAWKYPPIKKKLYDLYDQYEHVCKLDDLITAVAKFPQPHDLPCMVRGRELRVGDVIEFWMGSEAGMTITTLHPYTGLFTDLADHQADLVGEKDDAERKATATIERSAMYKLIARNKNPVSA